MSIVSAATELVTVDRIEERRFLGEVLFPAVRDGKSTPEVLEQWSMWSQSSQVEIVPVGRLSTALFEGLMRAIEEYGRQSAVYEFLSAAYGLAYALHGEGWRRGLGAYSKLVSGTP